ncbi:MAG: response regulator transcription factor [Casimicrobiaceae bacterium]
MPIPPSESVVLVRIVPILDTALDHSQAIKAEVKACAEDLGLANGVAQALIAKGATTLAAAQALRVGVSVEKRVQRCADELQLVTEHLAHGVDEVRAVERTLDQSRLALAKSEAELAEFRKASGAERSQPTDLAPQRRLFGAGEDAETAAIVPEAALAAQPPIKVIAVDDDDFMRELLARVLAGAGMQVMSYGSAEALLGALNTASATILLLDMNLPDMSGLELQNVLRRCGIDLPIVFISGAAELGMAVTAMRNGAADFIEKPFEGGVLIERVRQAVARHADRISLSDRLVDPLVQTRFKTLTPREREVFDLLVTGMSSKLIARELGGSYRTIEIHRSQIMRKMAARHLPELVRMSIESLEPRRFGPG